MRKSMANKRRWSRRLKGCAALAALGCAAGGYGCPGAAYARQNILEGRVSVGSDYDSNVYKDNADRTGEWKSLVAPELKFSSKGLTDSIMLTYAPDFAYNFRRQADEQEQNLALAAEKGISSRWKLHLDGNYSAFDRLNFEANQNLSSAQNFQRADPATQAEIVRLLFPELVWDPTTQMGYVVSQFNARYGASDRNLVNRLLFEGAGGRQRYLSTSTHLSSEYQFAEKSSLVLGYGFANQDYQTGLLANHTQQAPSIMVNYQVNQQWRLAAGYDLMFDSYGNPPPGIGTALNTGDSKTNTPHLEVEFAISPQNALFWNYRHQQVTFDGNGNDTTNQGGQMGWRHGFDPRTTLTSALGLNYLSYQTITPDEREYTLDLSLSRTLEKGSISLTGRGLTADANEAGGGWGKARQSWELGASGVYNLAQALSATGRASYGQWDSTTLGVSSDYQKLNVGAGLSYGLNRWLSLSLNYDYYLFDTNSVGLANYSEHLLSLRLTAAKELRRW